jgi:acetyltransferase-like isoleucine patch superfamily enzyme
LIQKLRRFLRTLFFGWRLHSILTYLASSGPNLDIFNFYFRPWLLRWAGINVKHAVAIMPRIQITPGKLTIGKETFINFDCRLACGGGISIGDYCQISARVSFETIDHDLLPVSDGKRPSHHASITVGNSVWIGSGAILLPGVTVGDGAVIAAGAIVTRDVAPYTLVGGVPARTMRNLRENEQSVRPFPLKKQEPALFLQN